MKRHEKIAVIVLSAVTLAITVGAGSASATTLEVEKVAQNRSVTLNYSIPLGGSTIITATGGGFANTCTESRLRGATISPFTGTTVTLPLTSLEFNKCTNPVTVDQNGTLHISHISGTTNGTVTLSGAKFTSGSPFGTLTCTTSSFGTHIGTLTGNGGGFSVFSTIHVNAVLNCGFFLPSAKWEGTYTSTFTDGIGVIE